MECLRLDVHLLVQLILYLTAIVFGIVISVPIAFTSVSGSKKVHFSDSKKPEIVPIAHVEPQCKHDTENAKGRARH